MLSWPSDDWRSRLMRIASPPHRAQNRLPVDDQRLVLALGERIEDVNRLCAVRPLPRLKNHDPVAVCEADQSRIGLFQPKQRCSNRFVHFARAGPPPLPCAAKGSPGSVCRRGHRRAAVARPAYLCHDARRPWKDNRAPSERPYPAPRRLSRAVASALPAPSTSAEIA